MQPLRGKDIFDLASASLRNNFRKNANRVHPEFSPAQPRPPENPSRRYPKGRNSDPGSLSRGDLRSRPVGPLFSTWDYTQAFSLGYRIATLWTANSRSERTSLHVTQITAQLQKLPPSLGIPNFTCRKSLPPKSQELDVPPRMGAFEIAFTAWLRTHRDSGPRCSLQSARRVCSHPDSQAPGLETRLPFCLPPACRSDRT
jgi:hypothetical protein